MGFNNKGVKHLVRNIAKSRSKVPLGISIGKNFNTPNRLAYQDYLFCLNLVYEHSSYVAINISSPNTKDLRKLESKESLRYLLNSLKLKQKELAKLYGYKPLLIKISPDNSEEELKEICDAIKSFNIDGVICSNTTSDHNYFNGEGGLSGSPLFSKSTTVLRFMRENLGKGYTIIASGGVMNINNYEEKIAAGADLVQIYTGFIYEGPALVDSIINSQVGPRS